MGPPPPNSKFPNLVPNRPAHCATSTPFSPRRGTSLPQPRHPHTSPVARATRWPPRLPTAHNHAVRATRWPPPHPIALQFLDKVTRAHDVCATLCPHFCSYGHPAGTQHAPAARPGPHAQRAERAQPQLACVTWHLPTGPLGPLFLQCYGCACHQMAVPPRGPSHREALTTVHYLPPYWALRSPPPARRPPAAPPRPVFACALDELITHRHCV